MTKFLYALALLLPLATACNAAPPAATDEALFGEWVTYATGSTNCMTSDGLPVATSETVRQVAEEVITGDYIALAQRDSEDPVTRCAVAHLVEDAGGVNHGHDDDPEHEYACHGMAPAYRPLLRRFLTGAL